MSRFALHLHAISGELTSRGKVISQTVVTELVIFDKGLVLRRVLILAKCAVLRFCASFRKVRFYDSRRVTRDLCDGLGVCPAFNVKISFAIKSISVLCFGGSKESQVEDFHSNRVRGSKSSITG